jgi:rubrerythrin
MGLEKSQLEDCGFKEEEVEQMINGFKEEGEKAKKNVLKEMNEQPDTWYCPECGWTGTIEEGNKNQQGEERQ